MKLKIDSLAELHDQLGMKCGYRVLYVPRQNISINNKIILIGLNPGGSESSRSFEIEYSGCAYLDEKWAHYAEGLHPLQIQVRKMFARMTCTNDFMDGDKLLRSALSGNLIPFRSPNWNQLPNKERALKIGTEIWDEIIDQVKPKIIIGFSGVVGKYLSEKFCVKFEIKKTGWGNISSKTYITGDFQIWIFPHLSTFKIFNSENCKEFVELFGKIAQYS